MSQHAPARGILTALALSLPFWILLVVAGMDREDAEITAKIEREVAEEKELPPLVLSHPIPWDAYVTQSGAPGELPRTRYYVRRQQ